MRQLSDRFLIVGSFSEAIRAPRLYHVVLSSDDSQVLNADRLSWLFGDVDVQLPISLICIGFPLASAERSSRRHCLSIKYPMFFLWFVGSKVKGDS